MNLEIKYYACDYKFETEYYFKLCKERALKRIKDINEDRTLVADYLYHTVRCGIAHGKDANVITYDFNDNLKNVAEDIYIVKLLARIESKNIIYIINTGTIWKNSSPFSSFLLLHFLFVGNAEDSLDGGSARCISKSYDRRCCFRYRK